jgi:hypothetical protein
VIRLETILVLSQDSSSPRRLTFQPLQVDSPTRHKSPALAWLLSWLVPGGGQGTTVSGARRPHLSSQRLSGSASQRRKTGFRALAIAAPATSDW